jgi:hypothetical protein
MMAKRFAPRARREGETGALAPHAARPLERAEAVTPHREEEWLLDCDDEQRSHRRKDRARAAKRKDASNNACAQPR